MNIFKHRSGLILAAIMLVLGSFMSCKGSKEVTRGEKRLGVSATLSKALNNKVLPPQAMISGKANAGMANNSIGFSYRIHILKDSLIWIKVTKFGFEGARALITPDSVFVINRLEKDYTATDYSIVKDFTGLEADFQLIQDMLFGNFHPIPNPKNLAIEDKKSNPLKFTGKEGEYTFGYDIESPANRLTGIEARHESRDEFMQLMYTAFETMDNKKSMAVKGELTVGMPDTATVNFHHTKVDLNPDKLSFTFRVPSSYLKSKK